jgi:alpha-L-rhamnosidase
MNPITPKQKLRTFLPCLALCLGFMAVSVMAEGQTNRLSIIDSGAVGDGKTLNTVAIQKAIDTLAASGGGALVVPEGVFVSGALYLKAGVNLHLEKNGSLRCSDDLSNFPACRIRIEGHIVDSFNPALINAKDRDGLQITGEGTLDGNGLPVWELFWSLRKKAPDPENFPNISIPRARIAFIENCRNVLIEGVTFKDSQFWNLHLYRCRDITIRSVRFTIPDDYKWAPSTDGIDLDSCQDAVVSKCFFSITDDCVALKGSRGPEAELDRISPPDERVRVEGCTFKRGHAAVTCGSEATVARDLTVTDCDVVGNMPLIKLKLRPDTKQLYENIIVRDSRLNHPGATLVNIHPWKQYFDLKGCPPPKSVVRNIKISGITGNCSALGVIAGNPGQSDLSGITLENITLSVKSEQFKVENVRDFRLENVVVNGKPFTLPLAK